MAIDYVTGPRTFRAPSGMLATESDIELLHNFVKETTSISAAQAAAAIVRVVQDAASASGASSDSVTAAQLVLTDLCKNPQPEAVTDLLVVCEYQVSFDIVDVFKLYSAAWKVVTGTCLKVTDGNQLPVPTRLRVLSSAMAGAQNMLLEVAHRSAELRRQQLGEDPLPVLTRYLKIARFHAINAARCCKAFLKFEDLDSSSEDQLVGFLALVLRMLAYVMHACNFNERIAESVRHDMTQNICPALGGIMRSVLSMVHSLVGAGDGTNSARVISKALTAMVQGQDCSLAEALGTTKETVQILAVLHLLRLAASQSLEDLDDGILSPALQGNNKCISLCGKVLESALLPILFTAMETVHVQLFTSRELQTGLKFLDCISLSVEECTSLLDLQCTSRQQSKRLEDFLLMEMNSRSAVRALISHRIILRLMAARKHDSERQLRLLFVALMNARLSLSLGTGYAERRWIPLASALALTLFKAGQSLRPVIQMYQQARDPPSSPHPAGEINSMRDAVVLRVMSCLCGLLLSQGEGDPTQGEGNPSAPAVLSPQRIDCGSDLVSRVLHSGGLDQAETTNFVKQVVLAEPQGGSLAEAAVHLLPYLMDGRSASGAAVACMKRQEASIQTQHRAINILNPALMSASAIQNACNQAATLIKRFGSVMCAPVAAFVARASMCLHQNVSSRDWQQLSSLLELAVSNLGKPSAMETSIDSLREAAVLYHATHALNVTSTLARSMPGRNTHATLPRSILRRVEDAQARIQQLQDSMKIAKRLNTAATDSSCILEEVAVCTKMHQQDTANSGETANIPREFGLVHQQLLISARRFGGNESGPSQSSSRARRYVDELRDLLLVLERAVAMSPPQQDEDMSENCVP